MTPRYNEAKTTEAAKYFLRLRGGSMSYMKLLKLLYIMDRTALMEWGSPVTFDRYVSMKLGPVLSNTYTRIMEEDVPGEQSIWHRNISRPDEHYDVSIISDTEDGLLSDAEVDLIHDVFTHYGTLNRWELSRLTHEFPEWQDPEGSMLPFTMEDVLRKNGAADRLQQHTELIDLHTALDALRGG